MKTLFASVALLATTASWAAPSIKSIEVLQTSTPRFPWHLTLRGTTEGRTRIALSLDAEGRVTDTFPIAYTRKAFADEAIRVAKEWRYKPLEVDGVPQPAVTQMDFHFESEGVVVERSVSEMIDVYLNGRRPVAWQMQPCPLKELDRIPKPLKVVTPPVYVETDKKGQLGEVTVQFYIDTAGKVRMPYLSQFTDPRLASLALEAVRQWEFEVPTRNGDPVIVRASQQFNFVAK